MHCWPGTRRSKREGTIGGRSRAEPTFPREGYGRLDRNEQHRERWWRQVTAHSRRHGSLRSKCRPRIPCHLVFDRWSPAILRAVHCSLWPDTDVGAVPRHIYYPSMLRAVRNVFLDRTNRGGTVQLAENDTRAAEIAQYSESSGSEAAYDQVFESASSTCSSVPPIPPEDCGRQLNHPNTMHHENEDDAVRDLERKWHFTQYGYRQFAQHNHQTITQHAMTIC